jgi:hypothetical protein
MFVASSSGYEDITRLLTVHEALWEENVKAQHKAISKETNDNESLANSNALLNTCGYPQKSWKK